MINSDTVQPLVLLDCGCVHRFRKNGQLADMQNNCQPLENNAVPWREFQLHQAIGTLLDSWSGNLHLWNQEMHYGTHKSLPFDCAQPLNPLHKLTISPFRRYLPVYVMFFQRVDW